MATALEQPSVGARRIDVMLEHLQGRRPAIEARLLACVHSVQAPLRSEDEHYRATTQALIAAVFDACLAAYAEAAQRPRMLRTARAGMGGDGEHVLGDARALVPAIVGQQAARAARAGIGADTLIRRMVAGASVMSVSLSEALRAARIGEGSALAYALRAAQSELLEAVGGVITLEHSRACGRELPPAQGRRLALVEGVLAGEAIDERELGYRLTGACHVAIVVSAGEDQLTCAALGLESLAGVLGLSFLGVRPARGMLWCWLGRERALPERVLVQRLQRLAEQCTLVVGPAQADADGFASSHRLAEQARAIAASGEGRVVVASEMLLALALSQQPAHARCLIDTYLAPLGKLPGGGERLRASLRAYIDSAQQVSSAAKRAGVSRETMRRHLRSVEAALGRPVSSCLPELATALALERVLGAGRADGSALA